MITLPMLPVMKLYGPISETSVTSAAEPVMKHSLKLSSSSGRIRRSTTSKPRWRHRSITDWRVSPFRKRSASGVWITPSLMKKILAPVHSATLPSQSSIIASA